MMWALDPSVKMPTEDELMKMPVEHEPKDKEEEVWIFQVAKGI